MKLSGFTIARNAIKYGYPLEASLRSLLPLVDELVVAVGDSQDATWDLVHSLGSPKIKAFRTVWDPVQRAQGKVLSQQTNLALARISGDWGVYLQADEVLHEDDLPLIQRACDRHQRGPVEGLRFDYLHFYGSYQTLQGHWRKWYRSAIRAVKAGRRIGSVGDAYGFRVGPSTGSGQAQGRRLLSLGCGARVFHYGWCRPPQVMAAKQRNLDAFYHDDAWLKAQDAAAAKLKAFYGDRGHLEWFRGSHPAVMAPLVAAQDWAFDHGIDQQAPWWLRQLQIGLLYGVQKRWRRWSGA
jgi:glycosyltransferase involved in cell wall biosynthesis